MRYSTSLSNCSQGVDAAEVAVADTGDATEAGGTANGTPGSNATGNVLSIDAEVGRVANGETRVVSCANRICANVGTAVTGTHGSVTINGDGTYTYVINNSDAAVQAL